MTKKIEVWSDLRCPWCWICHRQLGRVAKQLGGVPIEYRSFLLEVDGPSLPGLTLREEALSSWGLSGQEWEARRNRIISAGATEGLTINIDTALTADSRDGHRLLKLAGARGLDLHDAWDRMYRRHFESNDNIGDWEVLRSVGVEIGLGEDDLTRLEVESDLYRQDVVDDHRRGVRQGVRSIPAVFVEGNHVTGDIAAGIAVQLNRSVDAP